MKSKLKSISLSNWINRSPVLNLTVFGIVQPDASYKETEKRKRLEALALNALIAIIGLLFLRRQYRKIPKICPGDCVLFEGLI